MSFRISLGDIVELSGLAYTIGKALTTGRKLAPDEFQEVQNQLFAIGNALKVLSATLNKDVSKHGDDENDALSRMIENCRSTLQHLETVLQKYPELTPDSGERQADEGTQRRWRRGIKDNIKKVKWTTEGAGLDRLKQSLASHVNALNLAIAARSYLQAGAISEKVDLVHEKLGEIHTWFLTNVKDVKKKPERSKTFQGEESTVLTFSVMPDTSNDLLCSKASFKAEWIDTRDTRIFDCRCGSHRHDLNYTLLPVSLLIRNTTSRPEWKIHVFSREHNCVVSLILTNVSTAYQTEFLRCVGQLAMAQGARSAAIGTSSMLTYTSFSEDGHSSLSVLDTQSNTAGFKASLQSVTLISNGLRHVVEAFESVQVLHYMTINLSETKLAASLLHESPEFLPCRHGELVLHTKPRDGNNDSNITQLILKFNNLTVIDEVGGSLRVVMRAVVCSALLDQHEHLDIPQADAEITFTTSEAADSCRSSLKEMQRHLFISYLQVQREDEIVQSQKYIGDVMIQDMQLLDAKATIVQDLACGEQRMIISSKCGSKSVTVIFPAAPLTPSPENGLEIAPTLPAFFVNTSTQATNVTKQHTNTTLGGVELSGLLE